MELIEHKYLPQDLSDLITPNKKYILQQINEHISNQSMNLLLIGSTITFKSRAIHLIVKEYYKREGVHAYGSLILTLDCFNDINFSNTNNDIKTFCKSNTTNKKFLIIDNFDIINEGNQQYLKILMDTCKNTFFIFGCESTNKINEIIQTRVTPIFFHDLSKEHYTELIQTICIKENIVIDINPILNYSNITPYFIYNLFNKIKLLNKTTVDLSVDYSIFDKYITCIKTNQVKQATHILFQIYDKGYSLLDIYHFMYEYFKLSIDVNKYKCIEQLCIYIQHIYDGFDTKLMLLFYSNDLIGIYEKSNFKSEG